MGSSGTQPRYLQQWRPQFKTLIEDSLGGDADTKTVKFWVPVPDSRLRVKITVLFAFRAASQVATDAVDLTGTSHLWLSDTEDEDAGATGTTNPAVNIEGTQAAPTAIPATIGLTAYSREFQTSGDRIQGVFSTSSNGFKGSWVLQLRYQPVAGQRFTLDEWEEIKALCRPIVSPAGGLRLVAVVP